MRSYLNSLVLVLSLVSLVSCGGGNDIASGGTAAGVTSASAVASAKATPTVAAMDNIGFASVPAASILKVAYVDATATGSSAAIPAAGFAAPDIVIYGFVVDGLTAPTLDTYLINAVTKGVKNQGATSKTFISIGGETGTSATINPSTAGAIITNVTAGIKALNATLPPTNQIVGVDLDLEGGGQPIDAPTISALALGFKQAGFLVSIAPQAVSIDSTPMCPVTPSHSMKSSNPTLLGMASGGCNNQYGPVIASGNVDYIFVQAYNTGGWSMDGCDETQTCLVGALANAFNTITKPSCAGSNGTPLCIPSTTRYAIGLPSSRGAAGAATIWQPAVSPVGSSTPSYDYPTILNALATEITSDIPILSKTGKNGIMFWSLNVDYSPTVYSDKYACVGGFSSVIFGSTLPMVCPVPPGPTSPFTLVIKNTSAKNYVVANIFPAPLGSANTIGDGVNAIAPGTSVTIGTTATNKINPAIPVNAYLDSYFQSLAQSVLINAINISTYANAADRAAGSSPINGWNGTPAIVWSPPGGGCVSNFNFQANTTYTLTINADAPGPGYQYTCSGVSN